MDDWVRAIIESDAWQRGVEAAEQAMNVGRETHGITIETSEEGTVRRETAPDPRSAPRRVEERGPDDRTVDAGTPAVDRWAESGPGDVGREPETEEEEETMRSLF